VGRIQTEHSALSILWGGGSVARVRVYYVLRITFAVAALVGVTLTFWAREIQDTQLGSIGNMLGLLGSASILIIPSLIKKPTKEHKHVLKNFLAYETSNHPACEWEDIHKTLRKNCNHILGRSPITKVTGDIISTDNKRVMKKAIENADRYQSRELADYYNLALSVDAIIQEYRIPQEKEPLL